LVANLSQAATTGAMLGNEPATESRSLWGNAFRRYRQHTLAVAGSVVLLLLILMTAVGPLIYPQHWSAIDLLGAKQGPSPAHPMGTDPLGHDVAARIIWGGRISISVGLAAMVVGMVIGVTVGTLAGYFGGLVDSSLMRLTDLFIALPSLPVLMLTIYLFRGAVTNAFGTMLGMFLLIVVVIGVLSWQTIARVVRASVLAIKEKEFVEAAHGLGAPSRSIIARHIMPNVLSPVIVAATLGVAQAILVESSISFLGLGFPPDVPTWGRQLADAQPYIEFQPYLAIFPGLMIFLTVLSINYMGDGLRDALDPHHPVRA
jgi:peptide/nickel transport system permease protein